MLERANKRWDNAYTIYSNDLTEEEQKYKDYFETDLQNYREDERLEEVVQQIFSLSISNSFWLNQDTTSTNSISNNPTQAIPKTTRLPMLRRRSSNSNIEEPLIRKQIMTEETAV